MATDALTKAMPATIMALKNLFIVSRSVLGAIGHSEGDNARLSQKCDFYLI
jgi:hypothetical protein